MGERGNLIFMNNWITVLQGWIIIILNARTSVLWPSFIMYSMTSGSDHQPVQQGCRRVGFHDADDPTWLGHLPAGGHLNLSRKSIFSASLVLSIMARAYFVDIIFKHKI